MNSVDIYRNDSIEPLFTAMHAKSFVSRLIGLLGKGHIEPGGLLISPCKQIHTFGMRVPLDVVYLDKKGRILKSVQGLKPWRISAARRAKFVLELPVDTVSKQDLKVGERLRIGESGSEL